MLQAPQDGSRFEFSIASHRNSTATASHYNFYDYYHYDHDGDCDGGGGGGDERTKIWEKCFFQLEEEPTEG